MKIVEVIADSSLSGGPKHILDLLTGFQELEGFEFELIAPPGWLVDQVQARNWGVVHELEMESAFSRQALGRLADLLDEIKPNLIHAHGTRAGILLSKVKSSIPLVYTEHRWTADFHLNNPIRQWLQLKALKKVGRRATKVVGVSGAVTEFLASENIVPRAKLITIHNGIPIPDQSKVYKETDSPIIGTVGSLIAVKNYPLLLKAVKQVLAAFPKARLEIVGEGQDRQKLEELARDLGIASEVVFWGQFKDIEVKLLSWDVFVSTSKTESFGLALAEAMAVGLPVVATNFTAAKELVTEDVGFRVGFSADEVAKAIVRLLWEEDLRARLGEAGRRRIEANFSRHKMIRDLNKVYRQIV